MSISFLAPLFLAGLAALAIPLIVHLTHSARKTVVKFPSLMFVRQIPFRSVRRQHIQHWFLFLLRSAAVILLVTAFARPFLDSSSEAAVALSRAREVVILLDRSYSMGYADRWERAVEVAQSAIATLGTDDRATLVLFSERAESASQRTADRAALKAALARAELGSGGTRYAPALQVAREIVERSDRPHSEVILISDFQQVGWDSGEDARLPAGTKLTLEDLSDPGADNVAVADVMIERSRWSGGERAQVAARIVNLGDDPIEGLEVVLDLEGIGSQAAAVDLGPGSAITVQFSPVSIPGRATLGSVRIASDGLIADDAFNFVVTPHPPISVTLVDPTGRGEPNLYLRRVLGIGTDPAFDVSVRRASQLSAADLALSDVVILNDVPPPSGASGRALRDFVAAGGGLFVTLGRRTAPSAWEALGEELLPGRFSAPVDRSADGGTTLGSLNREHRIFEIFETPRSGDFTAARFFRYRPIQPAVGTIVLARFDDGTVALAERRVEEGTVLVFGSDLENFWNDAVLQPVFLPFVHRILMHLADYSPADPWFSVGDVVDVASMEEFSLLGGVDGAEWIIEDPTGVRSVLRFKNAAAYLELSKPGFYTIRRASGASGTGPMVSLAVNLEVAESDLAIIDPAELASAVMSGGGADDGLSAARLAELLTPAERERRQGFWWYLLVVAALLLLADTIVSNLRGNTRRRVVAEASE